MLYANQCRSLKINFLFGCAGVSEPDIEVRVMQIGPHPVAVMVFRNLILMSGSDRTAHCGCADVSEPDVEVRVK